jgi:hypothetical protein
MQSATPKALFYSYLVYFRDRVLIDGDLSIDTSPWIAVPMPDTPKLLSSLVDLAFEAQLPEVVHQVHASEPGTDNQHISFKVLVIRVVVWILCSMLIRGTNIRSEVHHCG